MLITMVHDLQLTYGHAKFDTVCACTGLPLRTTLDPWHPNHASQRRLPACVISRPPISLSCPRLQCRDVLLQLHRLLSICLHCAAEPRHFRAQRVELLRVLFACFIIRFLILDLRQVNLQAHTAGDVREAFGRHSGLKSLGRGHGDRLRGQEQVGDRAHGRCHRYRNRIPCCRSEWGRRKELPRSSVIWPFRMVVRAAQQRANSAQRAW